MVERCVCCGACIPEGRQVCPICEAKELQGGQSMVTKRRPLTKIYEYETWNEDGTRSKKGIGIKYFCPGCNRLILYYKSNDACDICGTFYDWGEKEPTIKTEHHVVWEENQNGIN